MTDNLLQKLEEKVITLVTDLEDLRKEVHRVKQENVLLKADKVNYAQKLQGLIALLDSIEVVNESTPIHDHAFAGGRVEEAIAV